MGDGWLACGIGVLFLGFWLCLISAFGWGLAAGGFGVGCVGGAVGMLRGVLVGVAVLRVD